MSFQAFKLKYSFNYLKGCGQVFKFKDHLIFEVSILNGKNFKHVSKLTLLLQTIYRVQHF